MNELKGRARQGGAVAGEEILIRDIWWHPVVAIKGVITAGSVCGTSKRRLIFASVDGGETDWQLGSRSWGDWGARQGDGWNFENPVRRCADGWYCFAAIQHINTTIDKEQVSVHFEMWPSFLWQCKVWMPSMTREVASGLQKVPLFPISSLFLTFVKYFWLLNSFWWPGPLLWSGPFSCKRF